MNFILCTENTCQELLKFNVAERSETGPIRL